MTKQDGLLFVSGVLSIALLTLGCVLGILTRLGVLTR